MCQKILSKSILIYYYQKNRQKTLCSSYFTSWIKAFFVVIIYKLLAHEKHLSVLLIIVFKLMVSKAFRCLKKVKMLDSEKLTPPFMIYLGFGSILAPEKDSENENPNDYINK